jgi:hypothetical protein
MIQEGPIKVCFGCDPKALLPISNLPVGAIAVRRRLRDTCVAEAFVRTRDGIGRYLLCPDGDRVKLYGPLDQNRSEVMAA